MGQYKYQTKSQGSKWMAKFRYLDRESGQYIIEYRRGFDTKRDAKQYEESFLDRIERNEGGWNREEISKKTRTFFTVYKEYLASHKHEDLKVSTLRTKENIFEHHIFPYFKDAVIAKITDDDIAKWQAEMKAYKNKAGVGYSEAYLRTIQTQFNSIINYANSKGYLNGNPLADIKNMGVKGKRIEFWTTEEYERFAEKAMDYPDYYYCFEVLYWCGLREGEMLALTPKDIDFENHILNVNKTYTRIDGEVVITLPKTESSIRKVSLPEFLCDELKEYMATLYEPDPDQRIFNVDKTTLLHRFHEISEMAGLKRITVHGLRHSHVSLLISRKYDIFEVSKRIGHKSVKTTQDTYGHLFDEVQRTIANDLDELRRR